MLLVDAIFRFSGLGMLGLLAILAFRSIKASPSERCLFLACISLAGLFLGYTPDAFDLPEPMRVAARLADIPHLVFIWLFALSLFEKDFRLRSAHWIVGGVYCLPIVVARVMQFWNLGEFPFWGVVLVGVMAFAIAVHLIGTILLGRSDDLSASRRKSRLYFSALIAFVTVSAAAVEFVFVGEWSAYLPTAKILTIWPAIMSAAVWMLQIEPDLFAFTPRPTKKRSKLYDALVAEMVERNAYLEPRLTIPVLAKRLGVTQHTLRELINRNLGYRNFSEFVNFYRIDAVKEAFSAPDNRHKSILEIAMENGFNSLSPFNKAFKKQVGVSPKEFRKELDQT